MDEKNLPWCPRCASPFIWEETHLVCRKCGLQYYINPRPCNAVILENRKGEILLVKRKFDPFAGMWDLPGGFINPGETAEDSVVREIREELGVTVSSFRYLSSYADRYLFGGLNYHTVCLVYAARMDNAILQAGDDITEASFFPKDKIPYGEIAFAGLRKALRTYIKETTR